MPRSVTILRANPVADRKSLEEPEEASLYISFSVAQPGQSYRNAVCQSGL